MGNLSSRLRLLVVDDEPLNLRALSRQHGSHEALEAQSFDQAHEILQEQSVDVVISDNRMPGRSGVDLLTLAASLQPETHRILLSANPPDNLNELIEQGSIHHFLPKPCSPELSRLLDSLCGVKAGPVVLGLEGTILADKYRLTALLGFGGMGYIYQAEQLGLERMVAVKLLRPDQVAASTELFHNEARAASRINHPNAVAIYDFGVTRDKVPYLVMEHLRGQTLAEILEQESLSVARVITIAAQILSALAEAHACGVVHRDLKAGNVILEPMRDGSDFVKVIDFGLARLISDSPDKAGVVGTPEYMAPEQIRGESVGPPADLYSVGVLLYEMLVGRTPFFSKRTDEVFRGHLEQAPIPPDKIVSDCPLPLSSLVLRSLEKSPDNRMVSAEAMRDELLKALRAAQQAGHHARCAKSQDPHHARSRVALTGHPGRP
jgi:serine/threonine protein kinase